MKKSRGDTSFFIAMTESINQLFFLSFILLFVACTDTTFKNQPLSDRVYPNVKTGQKFSFHSKVWLHRTNTLAKFRRNFGKYEGFEFDVVFNPNTRQLNVYHPPQQSSYPALSIFLQTDLKREKYYWLDMKNMRKENVSYIVDALIKLDKRYQLKDRIIIESTDPETLPYISKQGFLTSWCLANHIIERMPNHQSLLDTVSSRVFPGLTALSFDGQYSYLFVKNFPNVNFLCWCLHPFRNLFFQEKTKHMHNTDISVVLENEHF